MHHLSVILILVLMSLSLAHADEYKELGWDDLMPVGWFPNEAKDPAFFEGETLDGVKIELPKTDIAPIVSELDKQKLKLPGYIIPIKYDASSVSEFLLVPYVGACIHTPPPPENQIVYVSLKEPMVTQDLWAPVWVSGVMEAKTSKTNYATAGYHMMGASTEKYEY